MPGATPVPRKAIFQVRYRPRLSFYEKLFAIAEKLEVFPHWTTNRLAVTLRDFEAHHSISLAHNATAFETDSPDDESFALITGSVVTNLPSYVEDGAIGRIGVRRKYLSPV